MTNPSFPFQNYVALQDLPGALDDAAVTEALELHKIKSRQWAIFKTSATKGEGLFEGLDWYALIFTLIDFLSFLNCLHEISDCNYNILLTKLRLSNTLKSGSG